MKTLSHFMYYMIFAVALCVSTSAKAYDLVVAKDGSGNYTTVQAAIDAAPTNRTTPYTIYIKNGKYKEKINIPSTKPFLQIIGESVANVILTWDDYSGKPMPGGGVFGTSNSASFTVRAADFTAINITFENSTGESPQALAIYTDGDRTAFKNCRFLGGQDTIFSGGNGARQYFRSCYIDGTVDFIFGDARAVFDSCVIYAKTRSSSGSSYITAANTKQTEPYGYVFRDCKIPANRGGTAYFLGRPWQNDAATAPASKSWNKVVFINTTMSSSIQTAGWSTWDAGTDVSQITYGEFRSKKFDSSLVDVSGRVAWSKQLTATEAMSYNNATLFGAWNPCAVTADFCTYVPEPIAVSNFKGVKGTSTSSFTWNISWPMNQIKYDVLRSSDKINFTQVNTQTSVNDSTVNFNYSEAIPPPGQTYYYLIRASKTGYATHISDTVTISSTPTITVTGALGSFLQGLGTPSTSQSYVVSGASLTNNLVITAPTGYEISSNSGSTWNNSSTPLSLTPDVNGNVANTSISVRLNATSAGSYSGNIVHTSIGADTVKLAVTGTVQSAPLTVLSVLQWWPMSVSNVDSASERSPGAVATVPTFNKLYVSNGTTVPAIPAYSANYGQAFGATANGDGSWGTGAGGPGGNLNRTFYEEFKVTASATHSLKVDSLILTGSFYNTSSNTKLAVVYSLSGFATDSSDVSGGIGADGLQLAAGANGGFTTPVLLINETAGTTANYRFAFNGATGITLASGQTLTYRLYFSCGSSSAGRYAKIKNVQVKGLATPNPVTGDYRSHQTGDWTDLNSWDRWDGTSWVNPAPAYPVYNNSNSTKILNGHTITISATLPTGSGYIAHTTIDNGGQLIVNSGANLNIANDGAPSTATTDLKVDGALTLFGGIFTNGNVSIVINGSFVNSGTGQNLSNAGDTVRVGPAGTYQHNVNSSTTPAAFVFDQGSTFLITGLTTSQTGIFKKAVKYYNIVWNNPGETNYYAFRNNLDSSNVKGSFTVASTGTTYISFTNASDRTVLPGGFYQTGGTVNYRESGTVTDTLTVGGDFSVTGGAFKSNAGSGSSLVINLTGINKTITYSQPDATNTTWNVTGSYTLGSNLTLPSSTFAMNVSGTLNTGTYAVSGSGDVNVMAAAILSSGSPLGINGNITVSGTKSLNTAANYIFNGAAAQVTGALLPTTVNTLTINNASDVSLSGNVSATSSVTLTNGKLLLGTNTLTTNSALNTSSSRYFVTDGAGALKINNIGAGSNLFAVGPTTGSYNPVTINNAGTVDNFAVKVKTTFDNAVPDANKVVNRQWTINEDVAGGSNVTTSLSWLTADQAAGFDPAAASSLIRFNGASWENSNAGISGAGTLASPYVATASGFTSFSPFGVINNSALPLQLLSFAGSLGNNMVQLNWTTVNEVNTQLFEVERSANGTSFEAIGTVAAKNNSQLTQYSFNDDHPIDGKSFYRLKSVDKDGSYYYSKIISFSAKGISIRNIFPNPVLNVVTVNHEKASKGAVLQVMTTDGKVVKTSSVKEGVSISTVNLTSLPTGQYLLVYKNFEQVSSIIFNKK